MRQGSCPGLSPPVTVPGSVVTVRSRLDEGGPPNHSPEFPRSVSTPKLVPASRGESARISPRQKGRLCLDTAPPAGRSSLQCCWKRLTALPATTVQSVVRTGFRRHHPRCVVAWLSPPSPL